MAKTRQRYLVAALTIGSLAVGCGGGGDSNLGRQLTSGDGADAGDASAPTASDGSTGSPDADSPTEPDAGSPDASDAVLDATVDATQPDASSPTTGFRVRVLDDLRALAGVRVLFHGPTGALLGAQSTGVDGYASFDGAPFAVTLLDVDHLPSSVTYAGLAPGDDIVLDLKRYSYGMAGQVRVPVQHPSAERYSAFAGGGRGCEAHAFASPLMVPVSPFCVGSGKVAVVAVAADLGGVLDVAFSKGNEPPANDAGVRDVALGPWLKPTTATASISAVPSGFSIGNVSLCMLADGACFAQLGGTLSQDQGTYTAEIVPGFADALQVSATAYLEVHDDYTEQRMITTRRAPGSSLAVDLTATQPSPVVVKEIANEDLPRPRLSWTSNAAAGSYDAIVIEIGWVDESSTISGMATVILPPDATSLSIPDGENGALIPAHMFTNGVIQLVDRDSADGYQGFKRQPLRIFETEGMELIFEPEQPFDTVTRTWRSF